MINRLKTLLKYIWGFLKKRLFMISNTGIALVISYYVMSSILRFFSGVLGLVLLANLKELQESKEYEYLEKTFGSIFGVVFAGIPFIATLVLYRIYVYGRLAKLFGIE